MTHQCAEAIIQNHPQPSFWRAVVVDWMYQSRVTRSGGCLPMVLDAREPLNHQQPVGWRPFASRLPFSFITKPARHAAGETFITASGDCCDPAVLALIVALEGTCRDASLCCQELAWRYGCSLGRTRPDPVCIWAVEAVAATRRPSHPPPDANSLPVFFSSSSSEISSSRFSSQSELLTVR
jgi:hypothetical protein